MSEFKAYLAHIKKIEAERWLVELNISDYPKMKTEDRGKLYRSIQKIASPESNKPISFKEFARKQGNGIGKARN